MKLFAQTLTTILVAYYYARGMALAAGVKLAIGTDAHSRGSLGFMHFGVATAARGWATKADIVNTRTLAKLKSWLRAKRP